MRRISRHWALVLAVLSPGCADDADTDSPAPPTPDASSVAACVEGTSTCDASTYSMCQDGVWVPYDTCDTGETCVPGQGCLACPPGAVGACDGNTLFACAPDGSRGARVRDCEEGCQEGQCVSAACSASAQLIYVVDVDRTLLSFDPPTRTFASIGRLRCDAADTWPGFGDGRASPFSMAVDRQARAWILYSSGEIFWVDTSSAACTASPYPRGASGFQLFGMAFVSDGAGAATERLYVAGGRAGELSEGRLGRLEVDASDIEAIGTLPAHTYGAELTGNGNGELWAYWPGLSSSVARVDKTSAEPEQTWPLPPLVNQPSGWAFAHWGGKYWVFITDQDERREQTSRVLRFDPETGETTTAVEDTGHEIVGAGVSTCAPVVSNF